MMIYKLRAALLTCALCCIAWTSAVSQAAVVLPDMTASVPSGSVRFQFVSDGPASGVWGRPDHLARFYAQEWLPAFFSRTIVLDGDVPRRDTLSWIFTGPHAGFTVEIGAQEIRVFQRYYDSYALYGSGKPQQTYPETVVADTTVPYSGHPREIRVALNAHLALQVWVNGKKVIEQECLFDVQRHQLDFSAPRTEHDVIAGALLPVPTEAATITVDPARVHQTIMGFGGSPSIPAYAMLSEAGKKKYWEILRSYNLLINREYPMGTRLQPDMSNLDNPADAKPHYYGDNFPNGELSDFAYNRRIQEFGGSTIYEMWDLPAWATQPQGEPPSRHATADPEAYARAMVTYCRLAKERAGQPPEIVGVQNEVEEPPAVALEMVRVLRKRLDEAGFSAVKIHMADAPFTWQGVKRADDLRKHPEVWQSIDFAAVHEYDYQDYFTDPDLFDRFLIAMYQATQGKPFLATEICLNKTTLQTGSYRVAFNVGQLYHKDMTIMDAVELLYCWVILDVEQPNFGASRSLLIPDRQNGQMPVPSSFQLRVMGAFSRHIQKGMARVDAAVSNPDLLATAYRGSSDAATVVVLNRSDKPQKLDVKWSGVTWRELERTSPYLANAVSDVPADVIIQPGEIVTLSTVVEGPAVN